MILKKIQQKQSVKGFKSQDTLTALAYIRINVVTSKLVIWTSCRMLEQRSSSKVWLKMTPVQPETYSNDKIAKINIII